MPLPDRRMLGAVAAVVVQVLRTVLTLRVIQKAARSEPAEQLSLGASELFVGKDGPLCASRPVLAADLSG
jgi:hypothetical protein